MTLEGLSGWGGGVGVGAGWRKEGMVGEEERESEKAGARIARNDIFTDRRIGFLAGFFLHVFDRPRCTAFEGTGMVSRIARKGK